MLTPLTASRHETLCNRALFCRYLKHNYSVSYKIIQSSLAKSDIGQPASSKSKRAREGVPIPNNCAQHKPIFNQVILQCSLPASGHRYPKTFSSNSVLRTLNLCFKFQQYYLSSQTLHTSNNKKN